MPGLILIRKTTNHANPNYHLFAAKRRPVKMTAPLYHAPLPNVSASIGYGLSGSICWGGVAQVTPEQLQTTNLDTDYKSLLDRALATIPALAKASNTATIFANSISTSTKTRPSATQRLI